MNKSLLVSLSLCSVLGLSGVAQAQAGAQTPGITVVHRRHRAISPAMWIKIANQFLPQLELSEAQAQRINAMEEQLDANIRELQRSASRDNDIEDKSAAALKIKALRENFRGNLLLTLNLRQQLTLKADIKSEAERMWREEDAKLGVSAPPPTP